MDKNGEIEVNISEAGEWDWLIQITLRGLKSCVKMASLQSE